LAQRLAAGDAPLVVDVREPWEFELAQVAGSVLVPLGQVMSRPPELPRDRDLVLLCHHGMRSQQAAQALRLAGYTRLFNLAGGIDAWSVDVDPAVPRY
jgi:rhodanese-related sulfurtransferase